MYELTKIYKTKAMAVNAIRMTATNKGWKVLSTDDAAKHVWPAAEGFEVNNTTLNLELGFITEAEASVTEALAEQANVDTKAATALDRARKEIWGENGDNTPEQAAANLGKLNGPKLQTPSKLEQDKKAAKASKKAAKDNAEPKAPTRCETRNGARRPLRGKTLLVWEVTERLHSQLERVPSLKEVHEQLVSMEPGFNKTTTGIQYYACKAYNGWTK
jgi:hypothetical protein